MRERLLLCLAACAAVLIGAAPNAWAWDTPPSGVALPTGATAHLAGGYQALLAFPTGVAVSPDGGTLVTIAGAPITETTSPLPTAAIQVRNATTGVVLQQFQEADAFQSVAYSPDGSTVYVAGGGSGGVLAFPVQAGGMLGRPSTLTATGCDFVSGFALAGDGASIWVACPQQGQVEQLALPAGSVRATVHARGADQIALSGGTVYVTDWKGREVTAIDVASHATREISVGANPEGIVALPDGRVVVADSGDATVATIAPGADRGSLSRIGQGRQGTDAPSMIAAGPGGKLYVTLADDDAVAVLASDGVERWRVQGLIGTGWYPTALALAPGGSTLYAVSAKGLAHSEGATDPYISNDPGALGADGAYTTTGTLQQVPLGGFDLAASTQAARADLRPWGAAHRFGRILGPRGPIKHVIYITRENKLYDTVLGDLNPGPGTPLALFGQTVTPNLHAIARTWVNATSFYYPAYRSTSGHMWEDAGGPSDVYEREVPENYLDTSWSDPANYPRTGLLVSEALNAGLSVRTYNEELAQQGGFVPADVQAPQSVFKNYDLSYPDTGRVGGWKTEFDQFEAHKCTGVLAATYGVDCKLPSLEYVYLGEDHTTVYDEPGYPTIEAQVADNDLAAAQVLDAVSHSRDWGSTLVVLTEDDPQGTGDHVSFYRGVVALASPWVRRGITDDTHLSWSSIVGAIDRILGLRPLSDLVASADPFAEAFTATPDYTPFIADTSGAALYPFTPLPG